MGNRREALPLEPHSGSIFVAVGKTHGEIRRERLILIPLTIYIIIYYRAFSSRGAKAKTDGERLCKTDKIKNMKRFYCKTFGK